MFRNHLLVISDSYANVHTILRNQVRRTFSTDKVTDDSFLLHRSITNGPRNPRGFLEFKFEGAIRNDGVNVELQYSVQPPLIWLVVFVSLCAAALSSIIQVLLFEGSHIFSLFAVLFAAALYGFSAWQCSECVKAFESKFK